MRARSALVLAVVAAALLLAGCSGTSAGSTEAGTAEVVSDGTFAEGGAPAVAGDLAVTDKAAAVPQSVPLDRQVIRTGTVSMRADDVTKTAFQVHALVAKRNGVISGEDTQSTGDATYANITAQIPAADLDAFVADVSRLGTVDSISINAQDVTSQVVDLDARIKALQTSVDRMTQLLAQATRIEDLLAIETQLSQRQAELDSLKAQRTWLGDQVAMSTITVSIAPQTQLAEVDAPGFLSGLQSGWAAFLSLVMVAITAVGFFLPFLLLLALVAIPVTIVIVRQSRRRGRGPTPAETSTRDESGTLVP